LIYGLFAVMPPILNLKGDKSRRVMKPVEAYGAARKPPFTFNPPHFQGRRWAKGFYMHQTIIAITATRGASVIPFFARARRAQRCKWPL